MNPNYSSEMADRNAREYFEQLGEAQRDFEDALDKLKSLSIDFGPGSQQRFAIALRDASRARDAVWYLEQRRDDHV